MGFVKHVLMVVGVLTLVSCAASRSATSTVTYEEGYRQGTACRIDRELGKLNGNDFPYLDGTWARPLVQRVRIPAHVQGGVFYPEHDELAIITPGAWEKAGGWPIRSCSRPVRSEANRGTSDLTVLPGDDVMKGQDDEH